jgi:integrase
MDHLTASTPTDNVVPLRQVAAPAKGGPETAAPLTHDPRYRYPGIFADELRAEAEQEAFATAIAVKLAPATPAATSNDYTTERLLTDYRDERKGRGRAGKTIEFIESKSKPLVRLLPKYARDLTHAVLAGYVQARREQGAGESIRKEVVSVLGPALKLAYRNDLFERDPRKVLPQIDSMAKARERTLTPAEAWNVIHTMAAKPRMRHRAANAAFAIATGAELAAWPRAKREDARADGMGARVRGSKRSTRDRFAPTPLLEQQKFLRYALENAKAAPDGTLFAPWANARRDLTETCDELGLAPCSPNDLRRTYATWLGQHGVRDELIAKAMGHAGKTMVERHYRKLTAEDLLRLMLEDIAKSTPPSGGPGTGLPSGGGCSTSSPPPDTRTSPPDTGTRPHDTGTAQVAQSVEQGTENPRVGGSIPPLRTGRNRDTSEKQVVRENAPECHGSRRVPCFPHGLSHRRPSLSAP